MALSHLLRVTSQHLRIADVGSASPRRILVSVFPLTKPCQGQQKNKSTATKPRSEKGYQGGRSLWSLIAVAGGGIGVYGLWKMREPVLALSEEEDRWGKFREGLPTYSMAEVSKHSDKNSRIWMTYKEGVYDVTDFVEIHPGGERILMAAGGSMDPFWDIYAVHKNPAVLDMMEEYRIGNLQKEDVVQRSDSADPYSKEPVRHPALIAASKKPFNAETSSELLVETFITSNDLFYVRNHMPVPTFEGPDDKYEVMFEVSSEKTLTMADIKKLPKVSVTAAIQCAGNRRSDIAQVKPVKGLSWGVAAIGNAVWSGASLLELMKNLGVTEEFVRQKGIKHVHFEGNDLGPDGTPYGASIPIEFLMNPNSDIILAYEMNGKPLSRDHGYPLRVIIPGVVGARNVKWISRIALSPEEYQGQWQQRDYKGFNPSVDWNNVDFSQSPAIQELPVTSAICIPKENSKVKLKKGAVPVKGYAWSGGGKKIIRVDVSADNGKTWQTATLDHGGLDQPRGRAWAWTLWNIDLEVPKGEKEVEILVKATDDNYNTQPESSANIWNLRGVLSNAYHRVKVTVA
ncbi:unnamed protein product [Cyprideis torosa]|uniref:Sulfite oxidase n=1 Tax=Cyprideis torosa TaxID=163714 RepID=A0A7R8WDP8_9CRUS|nr:unnamed protein product [Cyprideis torosa]CAG0888585.1 unnamed protein product [Cyprideis torosa]